MKSSSDRDSLRVLVLSGYDRSLTGFRLPLLKAMVDSGWEVHAAAPLEHDEVGSHLRESGVTFHSVNIDRLGFSVWRDLRTVFEIRKLCRALKINRLLCYNAKPIIWGSIAGRVAGVEAVFSMVAGLGEAFRPSTPFRRILRYPILQLARLALSGNCGVFFQNPDDAEFFVSRGIVSSGKVIRINGSGVDLQEFAPNEWPTRGVRFLMIGRPVREKGVREFVEAARMLKRTFSDAEFRMILPRDSNYGGHFGEDEIGAWNAEGVVEVIGYVSDVRPEIAASSVFVLPSYYGEGTPRSTLEAMAMARAVVTTDNTGCRETVEQADAARLSARREKAVIRGLNGFLVPPRSAGLLAAAMKAFLDDRSLIVTMGRASRGLAERKFDVEQVNRTILNAVRVGTQG